MNETIIRNHNARVKDGDIVFHLGDFCFRNSSAERGEGVCTKCEEWESQLNGKIMHIAGNHDKNNGVPKIIQGMLINYHNHDIYMVHKPEHYNDKYKINFVGHVHEKWRVKKKGSTILLNVGVDVNKFMPINMNEAMHKIKQGIKGGI